jgi:prefoldin subunit 5
MSSTLFGRGTNSQTGVMFRAEKINRELGEIRELVKTVTNVPETLDNFRKILSEITARLDALNIPQLSEPVTMDHIDDLETKIEALKVLQAPQVTTASLQALERRVDAKIAALTKKLAEAKTEKPE